jgi:hypothetical protein
MNGWQMFWTVWLVISGVAFAAITLVVTIKGFGDVKRMLNGLKETNDTDEL